MLESKMFEVRDRATLIAVVATKVTSGTPREKWLAHRAGGYFGDSIHNVIVTNLSNLKTYHDVYACREEEQYRTIPAAMQHIQKYFDDLKEGDVIDVEFLLGEVEKPKVSEMGRYD